MEQNQKYSYLIPEKDEQFWIKFWEWLVVNAKYTGMSYIEEEEDCYDVSFLYENTHYVFSVEGRIPYIITAYLK